MPISTRRILVSNDDGINAPGIKVMERVARRFSDDVWVVAPAEERSGAGHSLTLSQPIRVRKHDEKHFSVSGTPTDCVMMALNQIIPHEHPTLVLSGVNRGGNLAEDVTYSGTVSVAMEGTLGRIPSIAFSQCIRPPTRTKWHTAEQYAPPLLAKLLATEWPQDVLMNVNFPAFEPEEIRGIQVTEQGRREILGNNVEERTDPRGFRYFWFGLGREGGIPGHETDLKAVRSRYISVTPLHLDLTHHETRRRLAAQLAEDYC